MDQGLNTSADTSGSDDLHRILHALPKVALHRHMEGSLRLETLAEIAREHQLDLPGYTVEAIRPLVQMTPGDPPSSASYLAKFGTLREFYRTPQIIERVAYEAVVDAAQDNVRYFEMRFTPIASARLMGFELSDVFEWVIGGVRRAEAEHNIAVRLIVSMNRHESVELGDQFVDLAIRNRERGVVGVDLAGAEDLYEAAPFAPLFCAAQQAGLFVTIHAGEWAGPANVLEAIETLGALRIGHGVRTLEDPRAVELARERDIAFEVCPSSNVQSGVVKRWEEHPLQSMYRTGLRTTINTDNTLVSAVTLTEEMRRAMRYLGFTLDDIKTHIMNAAHAAFLSPQERERLVSSLDAELHPDQKRTTA